MSTLPNSVSPAADLSGTLAPTSLPSRQFGEMMEDVAEVIAPVWPLQDYVAVNPYLGISQRPFMDARAFLKVFSDGELLMPVEHYAAEFQRGAFGRAEIAAALDELTKAGVAHGVSTTTVEARLREVADEQAPPQPAGNPHRQIRTIAEHVDRHLRTAWSDTIREEISKHCAAHYDTGQAVWGSPWKHLPLYPAWRAAAEHDRHMETEGLTGFRRLVAKLPAQPEAAIVALLKRLGVPHPLWKTVLLCQAFSIPGWSAWAKYRDAQSGEHAPQELSGLLAIRLAYDVALSEVSGMLVDWSSLFDRESISYPPPSRTPGDDSWLRMALLRASELAFSQQLLDSLSSPPPASTERKQAQLVFCIDVRSERIRRQLEQLSRGVETFGFAGFFGMPIEVVGWGERSGSAHLPVLLKPDWQVEETPGDGDASSTAQGLTRRQGGRSWRKLWKAFQTSAIGCFSFVETTGLFYAWKLSAQTLGFRSPAAQARFDGLSPGERHKLGPSLESLERQGCDVSEQTAMAHRLLTQLGLTDRFARLVVFCGHASESENNPLAAGLDCGACGGHSGEPNARLAARLLNRPAIRQELATRGIEIPADTYFLAGLHQTTTDQLEYFDLDAVPESHRDDVAELRDLSATAAEQTRQERLPSLASDSVAALLRRARDWSEVRPEWGLAGNAAFVVGPRAVTQDANLGERVFLHSYNHRLDPHGEVLEGIMTAPLIVAHWINMQYYASTVDPQRFGSGTKTLHNVVGRFGILSGNGGDLQTGLPWQSLHSGEQHQHLPLRLQAVIVAPRAVVERIISKHDLLSNLLLGGWLHLMAVDEEGTFRYGSEGRWEWVAPGSTAAERPDSSVAESHAESHDA